MKIDITTDGLLKPAKLRAWTLERQDAIRQQVGAAMLAEGREIARQANETARARFKNAGRKFPGIRAKLYAKDPNRMPSLLIGSKIPWLGIHERGGTINGRMLIPFGQQLGRIGAKKFRLTIAALMRSGNAYFRSVRGRAILFAENIDENARELYRFKRAYRKALGGGRIKKGADVPVAVLVSQVQIRARLGLEQSVRAGLPQLAAAIQRGL